MEEWGPLGVSAFAILAALLALILTTLASFNPVEEAYETAQSLTADKPCPSSWISEKDSTVDLSVKRCEKGLWTVYLENGGRRTHASLKNEDGDIYQFYCVPEKPDCGFEVIGEIPGWK